MRLGLKTSIVLLVTLVFLSAASPGEAISAPQSASVAPEGLTIDTVIQLHQAGVSEAIIITKIEQGSRPLDLSVDEILRLKEAGVPDAVVQALMKPASGGQPSAVSSETSLPADPNDPEAPHDSGIYLLHNDRDSTRTMTPLEPAAFTASKGGGFLNRFTSHMTGGIVSAKDKAVLAGGRSSIRAERSPTFYFYFADTAPALGRTSIFGGNITSPNQFVLLKLESKRSTRETVVLEKSVGGGASGTDTDAIVTFKTERLRPGVYQVTMPQGLEPGEYAFLAGLGIGGITAEMLGAAAPLHIFDFGVAGE